MYGSMWCNFQEINVLQSVIKLCFEQKMEKVGKNNFTFLGKTRPSLQRIHS